MADSLSLAGAITLLVNSAPIWLFSIRDAFLNKGAEIVLDKGLRVGSTWFHLDEKEQLRHLKRILRNAGERCVGSFTTQEDRDQLSDILTILSEQDGHSEALRREVMRLFTLFDLPNFETLSELYNQALRYRLLTQSTTPKNVDAKPYLNRFFEALKAEFYSDSLYHEQMNEAIKIRTAVGIQRSLTEVVTTLRQIGGALTTHYTTEQFEQDLEAYVAYMEKALRHLKLVGVVPKDRENENTDPELNAIFVPLRLTLQDRTKIVPGTPPSVIGLLEYIPQMVLLGGPGSGKSTATRHLSWSHAAINLYNSPTSPSNTPLLSGKPLPLRIELRRLTEDRRQLPDYDFLDYTTEVLLKRSGIYVHRQMFEELLDRKLMLMLFDGLDEVATLDDRRRLVDEIEAFSQRYPANRILVTSRPVGYELARFSNQSFCHVLVQEFDDQQIRMFLKRWYTHVLKLSPLPPDDRQELETFYTTLRENPRLHSLAANPLLLTVITALHRYERLPDRRILVYDRCADLLLDTWAKLKGTDIRWKDMKTGKEDQYACVAHLGFVLHERSQEKEATQESTLGKTSSAKDLASDVPARFILREVENFLKTRGLLTEIAEQHVEARRFLELMQVEAGLIVERGKDENGEDLYGFVHRTFQEYFAAADVYERYLQEEEPTIISQFLKEHLHDPHWHEVILLLLGKLKRKPATAQLRQLLAGKSRLSRYTNIIQQDLFFICKCLAEEINVDNELAETVVSRICGLVKHSPFPSQRTKGLEALASLIQTRQYASLGRRELKVLATQDIIPDISTRILAVQTFYKSSTHKLETAEQRLATQKLIELLRRPDLTLEQSVEVARALYFSSPDNSDERQLATQKLIELLRRSDLTLEQSVKVAQALYFSSPYQSDERQMAIQKLIELLRRPDLTLEQSVEVARPLYFSSLNNSEEEQLVTQKLIELLRRPDLTLEQSVEVARAFNFNSPDNSDERQLVTQKLIELLRQPDLTLEQSVEVARALCQNSLFQSDEQRQAIQKLTELAQRPDLTLEQIVQVVQALHQDVLPQLEEAQLAIQRLAELVRQSDLTFEQSMQVAQAFCGPPHLFIHRVDEARFVIQRVIDLVQRASLTTEQNQQMAQVLSRYINQHFENEQWVTQRLAELAQRPDLAPEQNMQAALALYRCSRNNSEEEQLATQKLTELLRRPDLTFEQSVKVAQALYKSSTNSSEEEQLATQKLTELLQRPDLTFEQSVQVSQAFYRCSPLNSEEQRQAAQRLWQLAQKQELPFDLRLQVATVPLAERIANYPDRAQAVQLILGMIHGEAAKHYFEEIWVPIVTSVSQKTENISDLPFIAELANQEMLPVQIRDEMYQLLNNMVPKLGSVDQGTASMDTPAISNW